ncbi:MAG: EamA family transporter, partial [Rhodobacteraceae bacterium]|nr:EamA family transporter [Paracoccaceae bacterium]
FASTGAWTVLAWGQQYVDSALAAVLNSTSPIWVLVYTLLFFRAENPGLRKTMGALVGLAGVVLIIGTDAVSGIGQQVWGQLAALSGAMMYGAAAIYERRFHHLPNIVTAAATIFWSVVVLVPASFIFEAPLSIKPSQESVLAALCLSIFSTGLALQLYFRLLKTLGSLGVTSQAYLRSGVGVLLGVVVLGETLSPVVALGIGVAVFGVLLINWPGRSKRAAHSL